METLAVFLYPEKVGVARVKAPGPKPSYSSLQWKLMDNVPGLLEEPLLLAALIREMVGDENKYDIYLNVWPGAYSAVMFSHDKKGRGDLNRLRQAELETVFHGEFSKMYTTDMILAKGKPALDGKCHRIIFTMPKERIRLMAESFKQQKLHLQRIAPMDMCCAEGMLKYWAPKDKTINVCMVLDEGCTSICFLCEGTIHAMRTIPNGFNSILAAYETITGLSHDECLDMIRSNGVDVTAEEFDMPAIQDDVLRLLNRITGETVKTLHNVFGDDAVIDKLLLCGNFVHTVGLVEYLNSMLETECVVAGSDTLAADTKSAIVLDENDLETLFPLASSASKGSDLMYEMKKNHSDKVQSTALCAGLTLIVAGLMVVTPLQKSSLQKQRDTAANLLDQPEYAVVSQLIDERDALSRHKNNLTAAIEALPHGATATADILDTVHDVTSKFGTVMEISTDYGSKTIYVGFTTLNYDSFVYWQKEIVEDGRFSFLEPPGFSGNGLIYTVEANLTATDFEATEEAEAVNDSAEGIG